MSSSLATHHKMQPTKTPYQWEEVLGAAQAGQWEEGVRPVLYKVHPGHRQQLFDLALDQRHWNILLTLLCQGFGIGRLEEVVDVALADPDGWEFLRKAVQNRCEMFQASLLQKIFTAASQQRLWEVLGGMALGMTEPAKVLMFNVLLALDLPGQPGQDGEFSLTASRYMLVINSCFHMETDYRLGRTKQVEIMPDVNEGKIHRKTRVVLDYKRRCQLYEQLLGEYIRTKNSDLEEVIMSNLHDCPRDIQERFFQLTAQDGPHQVARDLIAALSTHAEHLAAMTIWQVLDIDVGARQEESAVGGRGKRRRGPDILLLVKDAERTVERWTKQLFKVATDNMDCDLFGKLRELALSSPPASEIWRQHVSQCKAVLKSMKRKATKNGTKLKPSSPVVQIYESLIGKKVNL